MALRNVLSNQAVAEIENLQCSEFNDDDREILSIINGRKFPEY